MNFRKDVAFKIASARTRLVFIKNIVICDFCLVRGTRPAFFMVLVRYAIRASVMDFRKDVCG